MSDRPAGYFHVGVLVADLDEAIADFTRVLEIEFNPPTVMDVEVSDDDGPPVRQVRVSYSRQGPPYLELMQGQPSGFLSLARGEGVHHLGLWVPAGTSADLAASSRFCALRPIARVNNGVQVLTDPASLHGVPLELVDEARRPGVEAWIHRPLTLGADNG
jgi:catechol 2,3-dioxygenase-like lactoylglutathione lyase family enzyme